MMTRRVHPIVRAARRVRNVSSSGSSSSSSSSRSTRRSRTRRSTASSSSRPRYRNVQVAKRINRVEYVPTAGGVLKPMSIPEIVFKNERVPVASGSTARDESARSDGSRSQSKSAGEAPPPAMDDFPASDP